MFARVMGYSLGILAAIITIAGALIGTLNTIGMVMGTLFAASMLVAGITGGIGFVALPVISLLGIVAASNTPMLFQAAPIHTR